MGLTLFMGIWIPLGLLFRIDISHSFGLVRNHFLFDHGEAKSRHAHQVAFGTYGKLISTVITRYARIKTENSARSSLFDADDTVIDEELLKEWEEEEIERQRQEAENRIKELTEEGAEDEIPAYMLSMLQEFQHEEIEDAVPEAKLPVLAIIGRPNTGKSTIFNRLTSSFKDGAIVHDEPGITRDRTYRGGSWNDYNFQVVDTGGIIFDDTQDIFAERILEQALIALREADAAILVCDGQEGLTQLDEIITDWLRKNSKVPLYIAVNKCESDTQGLAQAQEFWALGFGAPFPVSGIHGTGLGELLDVVTTKHMTKIKNIIKEDATNVALVGRPNVGKSSLFNRLYGQDRAMVSDVAGTTRDTVDALLRRVSKPKIPRKKSGDKMRSMSTNPTPASSSSSGSGSAGSSNRVSCDSDQVAKRLDTDSSSSSSNSSMDLSSASTNSSGVTSVYRFIDTAGIRKRGKVSYGPEFFMVNRAFKAIRRAEVVVLVLDATTGLVDQDRILAERIAADGRACVIALNKWDAVPDKDDRSYIKATENIRQHLPALRWAEVALVSALTGQRTDSLLDYIDRAAVQFRRRISTAVLNEVVNDATNWMSPPAIGARAGRIYYCLQVSTAPPTIVFFVNDPALFTDNYQRFLERKIRDALDFEGTPIRMIWRGKSIRDVGRAVKKGALGAAASAVMKSGRFRDVGTSKER